jgi:hypothetical protein
MKNSIKFLLLACILCATTARAAGGLSEASQASAAIPVGSAIVVGGSMMAIAASGQAVVKTVQAVGDGSIVVLRGASDAATASIKLSAQAARELSIATGTVVSVVAMSTGYMLVASGKALAFIPNEIGASLLHHSQVK